jgi:DNA-binding transcriptional LysR family regulator
LTTSLTPLIVQAIHARHEAAHVRLRSANLDECFSLLLSRQVDIAIVYRLPGEDHPISQSFVETVAFGTDRLVPVLAAADCGALLARLRTGQGTDALPYVSFPPEVFLGRVLDRVILPRVPHQTRPVPRAETALTLAALELAAVGVGVAWVPQSLARRQVAEGSLVDLSSDLPSCPLEVTAVRLFGNPWPFADRVWSEILATGT